MRASELRQRGVDLRQIWIPRRYTEENQLAARLLREVGGLESLHINDSAAFAEVFPLVKGDLKTFIRDLVRRHAIAEKRGEHPELAPNLEGDSGCLDGNRWVRGFDSFGKLICKGNVESCDTQVVRALEILLDRRLIIPYTWAKLWYWNLGTRTEFERRLNEYGCLFLKDTAVLLFSDEIRRLKAGEPLKWEEPLWRGVLNRTSTHVDSVRIIDGTLHQVRVWF